MKVLGWDRSTSVRESYPGIDQLQFEHECTLEVPKLKAKSPAGSTIWGILETSGVEPRSRSQLLGTLGVEPS